MIVANDNCSGQDHAVRAREKVIRALLDFLDHKQKTIRKPGGFQQVMMDIEAYARSLPAGVRPFVEVFLLGVLERERSTTAYSGQFSGSWAIAD